MVLDYFEVGLDGIKRRVKFERICPQSSGTMEKQTKTINPKGLTIIAIVDDIRHKFESIFDKLSEYNFRIAPMVHLTFVGLFNEDRKSNPTYIQQTIEQIRNFFENEVKRKQFELRFDRVRPGTFYQSGTRDQFDSSNDGTVFVNGDINHDGNYRFRDLSKRLSSHLQEKLPTMFDANFGP
jgi:hypothetical protein